MRAAALDGAGGASPADTNASARSFDRAPWRNFPRSVAEVGNAMVDAFTPRFPPGRPRPRSPPPPACTTVRVSTRPSALPLLLLCVPLACPRKLLKLRLNTYCSRRGAPRPRATCARCVDLRQVLPRAVAGCARSLISATSRTAPPPSHAHHAHHAAADVFNPVEHRAQHDAAHSSCTPLNTPQRCPPNYNPPTPAAAAPRPA